MNLAEDSQQQAFPLSMADRGIALRILSIRGNNAFVKRVAEMGINIGAEVSIGQRRGRDLIIHCKGTRFALDAAFAQRVLVELIEQG